MLRVFHNFKLYIGWLSSCFPTWTWRGNLEASAPPTPASSALCDLSASRSGSSLSAPFVPWWPACRWHERPGSPCSWRTHLSTCRGIAQLTSGCRICRLKQRNGKLWCNICLRFVLQASSGHRGDEHAWHPWILSYEAHQQSQPAARVCFDKFHSPTKGRVRYQALYKLRTRRRDSSRSTERIGRTCWIMRRAGSLAAIVVNNVSQKYFAMRNIFKWPKNFWGEFVRHNFRTVWETKVRNRARVIDPIACWTIFSLGSRETSLVKKIESM